MADSLSSKEHALNARTVLAICAALVALTWAVFGQTLGHEFVDYDDGGYVYENPEITGGLTAHGLANAFTQPHARNWHPLTTITHMLDCQLYGIEPTGHHFTNVLLHTAAVVLLFLVLRQMTGATWRSAFVAAVFAIHPLRAESVAWVSERKDVLSAVFFMLTIGAYARYVRLPSLRRYAVVALVFALGVMSKPMLVTGPVVLLLLDYWPLCRVARPRQPTHANALPQQTWTKLLIEKLPLLALSAGSAIATLIVQRQTVAYSTQVPMSARIGNAVVSYVVYLRQTFWPAKLSAFYPHPGAGLPPTEVMLAAGCLIGLTVVVLLACRSRPYLFTGWCWYLVMLVLVIGVMQVGMQAHADRYTYLPQIGICVAIVWWIGDAAERWRHSQRVFAFAGTAIVVLLAVGCWRQTSYWRDTEALWGHAADVSPQNDLAHYNLGVVLAGKGRLEEAVAHYEQALNIGGGNNEAASHLSPALVHKNLAAALAQQGRADEAMVHLRDAIRLRPDYADAHTELAMLLAQRGDTAQALEHYERAAAIPPEDAASQINLAAMLARIGRESEAIVHYKRALTVQPDSVAALANLAWLYATSSDEQIGNGAEAVQLAEQANRLTGNKDTGVLRTLAAAYAEAGRFTDAVRSAEHALELAKNAQNARLAALIERELSLYRSGERYRAPHNTSSVKRELRYAAARRFCFTSEAVERLVPFRAAARFGFRVAFRFRLS
jgi:tetratricopeptide (TPR) repeat protein